MGNAPWLSKWGRSPRQDRRVVENGKFVEQGQVHLPEPPAEVSEQEQSALEIVQETANVPVREEISGTVFEEARYESAEEQEGSAATNVLPDAQNGSSESGFESSDQPSDANSSASVGVVEEVPNASVSTAEGPSVSEASPAELEPIPIEDLPSGTGGKFEEWRVMRTGEIDAAMEQKHIIDAVTEHEKGS